MTLKHTIRYDTNAVHNNRRLNNDDDVLTLLPMFIQQMTTMSASSLQYV